MSDLLHKLVIHVDYKGNRIASIGFTSPEPTADVLNIIPDGVKLTFENKGCEGGLAPVSEIWKDCPVPEKEVSTHTPVFLEDVREFHRRKAASDARRVEAMASGIWTAQNYPTTADSATEDL